MAPKSVRKQSRTDSDSAEAEGESYRWLIDKITPVSSSTSGGTEWITTGTGTAWPVPGGITMPETASSSPEKVEVSPGVDALRKLMAQEEKHLEACERAERDARKKIEERERLTGEARERVHVLRRELELLEQFNRMREAGEV